MTKYEELQAAHQQLLEHSEEVEYPKEILDDVQAYIERIKADAEYVSDVRDRNQLRANLRYWASFVYDHTGSYPNTTLRPASVPETEPEKSLRTSFTFNRIVLVVIFAAIAFIATSLLIFNTSSGFIPITGALPGTSSPTPKNGQTLTITPPLPSPTETEKLPDSMLLPTSTPTWTASPSITPTRMRTATETPVPSQAIIPTLDEEIIEIWETDTPLIIQQEVVSPATEDVILPETGGGEEPDAYPILLAKHKAYLAARLMNLGQPVANCGARSLTIAFDPINLLSKVNTSASVEISQGGRVIATSQMPFRTGTTTVSLPNSTSNAAVLVQVNHPGYLFETVIVQFYSNCSRNRQIIYYRPDLDQEFPQTDPSALQVTWRMSTWGPAPDDDSWISTLQLVAHGGDGNYIYWASGDVINSQGNGLLLDDQLFTSKQFCDPAQIRIGVTSAGWTIQNDMVLQLSQCIEIDQTPTPSPTHTNTPSLTLTSTP